MTQLTLALRAGQDAIRAVSEAADPAWCIAALEAVRLTCVRHREFISDDVWDSGLDSTREDRALGPIMLEAKRLGYCCKTDRTRPSRRSHGSGKPIWVSLIWEGPNG